MTKTKFGMSDIAALEIFRVIAVNPITSAVNEPSIMSQALLTAHETSTIRLSRDD